MGFELRDHTADVAVAATGDSLEAVFEATADGLTAASCDEIPPESGERFSLTVAAERREALLFDYLGELIYLRDVRAELPVDNRVERIDAPADGSDADVEATAWSLEASARGVPLAAVDAREVKAVTYSEMRLESVADGWETYVVFDV
ncbi:hypothetical protein A6E15_07425 [Natrinema saccharevitans]|uniref:Archease domain-containing protein n=1 Tax=Natrinema saccharevitans TaxID=301967 RepID=A0A1S8B1E2_9EURY|nr:archease [Natrinema saccharevitans]OLZ42656.1 hypothetical protein A6E15_07425 [Natrinema saccharevitans]